MGKVILGYNDLFTQNPELASEWHPTKNGELTPDCVAIYSDKKVWWLGKCGHEWDDTVGHRSIGRGCPYCFGHRVLKGFNDLATKKPELVSEWHPTKNGDLIPEAVIANSDKKVWWRCSKGHEWQATVGNRSRGNGCPYCSGRFAIKGETDLVAINPQLAKEWHPTKNDWLTPEMITTGSGKKVWWLCSNGHEWQATILSRKSGCGCPYCSGRFAIKGETDLATVNQQLAKEWHPTKNRGLLPEMVTANSHKKVWWQCPKGHEWQSIIKNRSKGTGCPICNQEKQTSFAEQAIFFYLRQVFPDVVNRDMSFGKELDIYIPSIRVAIEYDGSYYHKNIKKDKQKNDWCQKRDISLIRIRERECPVIIGCETIIQNNDDDESLEDAIIALMNLLNIHDVAIDIDRDRHDIYNAYIIQQKEQSLLAINPELAKEWHPIKNGNLTPDMVFANSGKKVWWRCSNSHEWQAVISSRSSGRGCPYCAGQKVLKGFNDLVTVNPELASEWHPTKNGDMKPDMVTVGCNKKVWWQCSNGHEWQAVIHNRSKGSGCPYCAGRYAIKGETDIATINPELAKEWHPTKNGDLAPEMVTTSSNKEVWWLGKCGHVWKAVISDRNNGHGCPYCTGKRVLKGFNDFATKNPELASEWHPTKNGDLKPNMVTAGSGKKVWWICSKGHEWQATILNRKSGGCPYCSGHRVLKGFNDLATRNPELASEWHPTKNGDLKPEMVTASSDKKVWWLGKCGHEWQAIIANRSKGNGCPYCSGKKVLKGYNDLATKNPRLASEWHLTKNDDLSPDMMTISSGKKVWWQCSKGHEWQAIIAQRSLGGGCPYCAKLRK